MNSTKCNQNQHDQGVWNLDKKLWTLFDGDPHQQPPSTNLSYFNQPICSTSSNTAIEIGKNDKMLCQQSRPYLDLAGKRGPKPQSSSIASKASSACSSIRKTRKKERLLNTDSGTVGSEKTLPLTKENVQNLLHGSSENTLIKSSTTTKSDVEPKRSSTRSVSSLASSQTLPSPEAMYKMRKLEKEIRKHEEQLNIKNRDANLFPILHTIHRNIVVSSVKDSTNNVVVASSFNNNNKCLHIEEKIESKELLPVNNLKESTPLSVETIDESNDNNLKKEENKKEQQQQQPGETLKENTTTTDLIQQHQLKNLDNELNSSDLETWISPKLPSKNDNPLETKILNGVSSSKYVPAPNTIKQFDINGSAWSEFVLLGVDYYGFFILTFPMGSNMNKTYQTMKKNLNSFYSSVENQKKYRFNPKQEISNGTLVIVEIKSNMNPIESSAPSPSTKYIRAKVFDMLDNERKIYSCVGVDDFLEYIVCSTSIFHLSTDFTFLPSKVIMCLLSGTESRVLKDDLCKAYKQLQSNPETKINALVRVKKLSFQKVFKVPTVDIMTTSDEDLFQLLIDIRHSIINWFVSMPVSDSRRRKKPEKKNKYDSTTELSLYQEDVLEKLQERNYFAYL